MNSHEEDGEIHQEIRESDKASESFHGDPSVFEV